MAPTIATQYNHYPLGLRLINSPNDITPQHRSPLYATLPPEVREIIWYYALQQYEDSRHPYDLSGLWVRPGWAARPRIAIELLLTCRLVYTETFLLPAACNSVYLFDSATQDQPPKVPLHVRVYGPDAMRGIKPWQLAAITRVDLTVQQAMLEGGALERCSRKLAATKRHDGCRFEGPTTGGYPCVQMLSKAVGDKSTRLPRIPISSPALPAERIRNGLPITHLTIRINRTDWWTWADAPATNDIGKKLRLEPMINTTCPPRNGMAMQQGLKARQASGLPDYDLDAFEKPGRWGLQVTEFWPDLQTLELVLETFEAKEAQLDEVVASARWWTFPMTNHSVLEIQGDTQVLRWEGAKHYRYSEQPEWIEPKVTWSLTTARDVARSLWRRMLRNRDAEEENGQRVVAKRLIYERRRVRNTQTKV